MTKHFSSTLIISVTLVLFLIMSSCGQNRNKPSTSQELPSLREVFEPMFIMGTTINESQIMTPEENVLQLVKDQFGAITAENKMKWENIHPSPGVFNFEATDSMIAFAGRNNLKVIGHTLIWHSQTPDWVFEDDMGNPIQRDALIDRMRDHIFKVAGRYKGRVYAWDVVNEAVLDNGSMRDSKWRQIIGDDYISLAFEFAAQADPGAKLYYNDYSLPNPEKRAGAVELISSLLKNGVRVDGIGMQGHYHFHYPIISQLEESIVAHS